MTSPSWPKLLSLLFVLASIASLQAWALPSLPHETSLLSRSSSSTVIKGAAGTKCKHNSRCSSGLCFNSKCLGSSNRPFNAPCNTSNRCGSGYCGHSRCAIKASNGKSCYKNAGCKSGFCKDLKICSKASGSTSTSKTITSTLTSTSSTATATSTAASDGSIVVRGAFDDGTLGTFTSTGDVKVVNDPAEAASPPYYVRLSVTDTSSPVLSQSITSNRRNIEKRQSNDTRALHQISYFYRADSFLDLTTAGGSSCAMLPTVNTVPQIAHQVDATNFPKSQWSAYSFVYTGEITSFAFQVLCGKDTFASFAVDSIMIVDTTSRTATTPPIPAATFSGTQTLTYTPTPAPTNPPRPTLTLSNPSFDDTSDSSWTYTNAELGTDPTLANSAPGYARLIVNDYTKTSEISQTMALSGDLTSTVVSPYSLFFMVKIPQYQVAFNGGLEYCTMSAKFGNFTFDVRIDGSLSGNTNYYFTQGDSYEFLTGDQASISLKCEEGISACEVDIDDIEFGIQDLF